LIINYEPMDLEQILEFLFVNKTEAFALVKKYDLESILQKGFEAVKNYSHDRSLKSCRIGDISAFVLMGVNNKLKVITDLNEKRKLELLLRDIANYLIGKTISTSTEGPENIIQEIKLSCKAACEFHDYNYEALLDTLDLHKFEKLYPSSSAIYYDWNGSRQDLDELARNLKSDDCIQSVREFKFLFSPSVSNSFTVHISKEKLPFLLALFDELKFTGLITPKGNKGHFHPLRVHGVDFDQKVLIQKDPKSIKFSNKKNTIKWTQLSQKAKNWIDAL